MQPLTTMEKSKVVLIPKDSDPYRPVWLVGPLTKGIEDVIGQRLGNFAVERGSLSGGEGVWDQYGF